MLLLLGAIGMIFKMNNFNNLFVLVLMLQFFQFGKEKEMDKIFFFFFLGGWGIKSGHNHIYFTQNSEK